MRILILTEPREDLSFDTIERTQDLAKFIQARGHEVQLIRGLSKPGAKGPSHSPISKLSYLLCLPKPNLLIVETPPPWLGWLAWAYSKIKGCDTIFNVSEIWPRKAAQLGLHVSYFPEFVLESFYRRCLQKATFVSVLNHGLRETLVKEGWVHPDRLVHLPRGYDSSRYVDNKENSALKIIEQLGLIGKRILLFTGVMDESLRWEPVIECARRLAQNPEMEDIVFLFVGNGSVKKEFQESCQRNGLNQVFFFERLEVDQMAQLHIQSWAGFASYKGLSQLDDQQPGVLIRTLAAGRPMILLADGEANRLVHKNNTGLAVSTQHALKLFELIERLHRDPAKYAAMAKSSSEYANQYLRWEHIMDHWFSELQQKLSCSNKGAQKRLAGKLP